MFEKFIVEIFRFSMILFHKCKYKFKWQKCLYLRKRGIKCMPVSCGCIPTHIDLTELHNKYVNIVSG